MLVSGGLRKQKLEMPICCQWRKDALVRRAVGHHCAATSYKTGRLGLLVRQKDMSLKEFRCRHHRIEVPLRFVGCSTEMSLPCFLLKQSVDGCRLLWSLTHLHRLVLGKEEKMTPSRWLHSWWQWWLKLLTQFHMGSGHLRKAAGPDADDSEVYRIFDVPVVSTAMLLLLSARFAADSRGSRKKISSRRMPGVRLWRHCLRSTCPKVTMKSASSWIQA